MIKENESRKENGRIDEPLVIGIGASARRTGGFAAVLRLYAQ